MSGTYIFFRNSIIKNTLILTYRYLLFKVTYVLYDNKIFYYYSLTSQAYT